MTEIFGTLVSYASMPRCRSTSAMRTDHRCAHGRFTMFTMMLQSCVTVWNQSYLSSRESRVSTDMRRRKFHQSDSNRCQESVDGICYTDKQRAPSLRPSLGYDSFKPTPKRSMFKCISWRDVFFFFCPHTYSLWQSANPAGLEDGAFEILRMVSNP